MTRDRQADSLLSMQTPYGYVEKGFVPGFSSDSTNKLIVEYERKWKRFDLLKTNKVMCRMVGTGLKGDCHFVYESPPAWTYCLSGSEQEADFEYFPHLN